MAVSLDRLERVVANLKSSGARLQVQSTCVTRDGARSLDGRGGWNRGCRWAVVEQALPARAGNIQSR